MKALYALAIWLVGSAWLRVQCKVLGHSGHGECERCDAPLPVLEQSGAPRKSAEPVARGVSQLEHGGTPIET